MKDEHKTIAGISESQLVVKKSRFISLSTCVRSRDEFTRLMESTRQSYPAASHYCFAYTIGYEPRREERASDAGEPTHSAGPPILKAVQASRLTNIACIVVRYFGGTKLGIGGLIRAYGRCARDCLAEAKLRTEVFTEELVVTAPYEAIGVVIQWVERARGNIIDIEYGQHAQIRLELRLSIIPDFSGEVANPHRGIHILTPTEKLACMP